MNNVFRFPYQDKDIVFIPFKQILLLADTSLWHRLNMALEGNLDPFEELGLTQKDMEYLKLSSPFTNKYNGIPQINTKPTSATVFLTGKCTCRCLYCYANGGDNPSVMDWDLYSTIVGILIANCLLTGTKHVKMHFHGGGDISADWKLFRKAYDYLYQEATNKGLKIFTSVGINGVLSEEQAVWIARNVNNTTFSLDGSQTVHDMQRPLANGKGSYVYAQRTLRIFDKLGYNYGLRMTVTDQSVDMLPGSIEDICSQYKVHKIMAEPMFPMGRTSVLTAPSQMKYISNFISAKEIAKKYNRQLTYSGANLSSLCHTFCGAAGNSYCFTQTGKITSCYEIIDETTPLGEMFVFGEVNIKGKKLVIDDDKIRYLANMNVTYYDDCEHCFCKWHCAGDCPAKRAHSFASTDSGLHYRCKINKALFFYQILEALDLHSNIDIFWETVKSF
ncbi:MAG: SPASM domain-containing protein [Candidatus Cloacimonetes bacterium]|nr:SPASM domain-containing protein [Candidatus Cloacimonadota bacterium]